VRRIQLQWSALLVVVAMSLTTNAIFANRAFASIASQRYYAKGLVPFDAGEWERAYVSFTNATRSDSGDALAHYYRGVTGARLGFIQESIADLEKALEVKPDLQIAVLDLGVLYLEAGEYERAESWLQRAKEIPQNRFQASLFLGIANFRRGDDVAAQKHLRDAAKNPRLRPTANYYEGLVLLRQGKAKAAQGLLDDAERSMPGTELATAVAEYKTSEVPMAYAGNDEKAWSVYGELGFAYDSNVSLSPNSSRIRKSRNNAVPRIRPDYRDASVGRTQLGVGARYRFLDNEIASGAIGYELYQDFNFNNSDFNVSSHRIRLDLNSNADRWYQVGLSAYYNYYGLDFSSFFHEGTVVPWAVFYEGDVTATQVYYRFRGRDYTRQPFQPFRDALNNAVGVRQLFLLGAVGRTLSVGYQWSDNDPLSRDGTDFAYQTHQFDVEVKAPVRDWFDASLGYAVLIEDYEHPNSRTGFTFRRHDAEHQIVIRAERPLTQQLTASLDYYGILNHSNLDEFDYDRNIISANVRMRF